MMLQFPNKIVRNGCTVRLHFSFFVRLEKVHDSFYVVFYLYVLIFIIGRRKGSIFLTGI